MPLGALDTQRIWFILSAVFNIGCFVLGEVYFIYKQESEGLEAIPKSSPIFQPTTVISMGLSNVVTNNIPFLLFTG